MVQKTKKGQSAAERHPDSPSPRVGPETSAEEWTGPDPVRLSQQMSEVMERARPVIQDFISKHDLDNIGNAPLDPFNMRQTMMDYWAYMLNNPEKFWELQNSYWHDMLRLWQSSTRKFLGEQEASLHSPARGDRRFRDAMWSENPVFDYLKQSYLLSANYLHRAVQDVDNLDSREQAKLDFYTQQFINALSPSNFALTNPEVLRETFESGGENLINGLENLVEDLQRGDGELKISKTDYDAFEVGRNLAVTPGKVVYQNELMQLIQYSPQTKEVFKTPLLIIPPWINKYYILDLREENSLIRWAVEQGHTVFTISWVNPDKDQARKSFGDYMEQGVLEALKQVEKSTGESAVNTIGYCIGGTLLSTALAWMKAKKQSGRIKSATFLTTLIDFDKAGDLRLFTDDEQIEMIEAQMKGKGYLEGKSLQDTFSILRSNDLIWTFVVNNYLLGREPFPFDLLYWNDDSTNMPAAMHSFYLRNMYRDNKLKDPGSLEIGGVKIDIRSVDTPAYFLSTREDHIAPWRATYDSAQLFSGPVTFTLAASGHVAGVVNPPAANKYGYWVLDTVAEDADSWLEDADYREGSWWPHWNEWAAQYGGGRVKARQPGDGGLKVIEDAPGTYVKMRYDRSDKTA